MNLPEKCFNVTSFHQYHGKCFHGLTPAMTFASGKQETVVVAQRIQTAVSNKPSYQFWCFHTFDKFIQYFESCPEPERTFCSVNVGEARSFYLDIDCYLNAIDLQNVSKRKLYSSIISEIKRLCNVFSFWKESDAESIHLSDDWEENFSVFDSSRKVEKKGIKVSCHIINPSIHFCDLKTHKKFSELLQQAIPRRVENLELLQKILHSIDLNIYHKTQLYRIAFNHNGSAHSTLRSVILPKNKLHCLKNIFKSHFFDRYVSKFFKSLHCPDTGLTLM